MISELKALPPSRQRELIRMFDPASLPDEDSVLWPTLVEVIKVKALDGRASDDLPLVIRERLVDVLTKRFEIQTRTDGKTDMELAFRLIVFLEQAWRDVQREPAAREAVNRFFSRKNPTVGQAVEEVGGKLEQGLETQFERPPAGQAHRSLAGLILDELGPEIRQDLGTKDSESAVERALMRLDATKGSRRLLRELSPPALGQLAGAIYMAGITAGPNRIRIGESDAPARARRGRHSTTLQNTVVLSAFLLAAAGEMDVTANRVADYLERLGYDYEALDAFSFRIPRKTASVQLDVVESFGGSQVNIWSEVGVESDYRDQDLANLLEVNEISRFAKFSIDKNTQGLEVGCELFGDTLDIDELGLSLANVITLATAFAARSPDWMRNHLAPDPGQTTRGQVIWRPPDQLDAEWKTPTRQSKASDRGGEGETDEV